VKPRHKQLLDAIEQFLKEKHYSPSEEELAAMLKVHRSAINKWLKEMEELGIIERPGRGRRTLRILQEYLPLAE
jgi:DNA-binding GntR family transcriptional regulator